MSLNRRDFMKLCAATTAGLGVSSMAHPAIVSALENAVNGKAPVIWLQGCGCTGCSVSILNAVHPHIADVLLKIISLEFHPTVMAWEGEGAVEHMFQIAEQFKGKYFLIVEGSVPTADPLYCVIGEYMKDGHHVELTLTDALKELAPKAAACVAVGACATYGGIPAAKGNLTGSVGVQDFFKQAGIKTPVVNIGGCPPHPDWMVGSLAYALEHGLAATVAILDQHGRPKPFFGKNIHDNCPYLPDFNEDRLCETFNDKGCKLKLGCKGPETSSDCYNRIWNNGVNWCVENSVCIGCVEPGWPDAFSPFYESGL